ncbi:polysaccharide pyruvyl transferase family protein [Methanosarcina sp.]|uniref:polysaccharide pyruvyl transferase family protein n=1 Tax=Methanosarcina sp. TaxID=2213 RepID=UPI00298965C7|nr:polysaccharide pyruvyl transferase family protein [Methanosarcina sp.]MDW5549209.1 polysaccharide pyruvyl transferase family protein [Methanosarcina sp.]MDW5553085.1 polysaccharide pyruvyl transferase family protein [Methanosarcina sp.]MDW5559389.1 polysaccharide pyruvyl transferase family protein [Methanosarcina sp.]
MIINQKAKKLAKNPGRILKIVNNTICNTVKIITIRKKYIIAFWWAGVENNWGDALNPILIESMTGRIPVLSTEVLNINENNVYCVIGSTLGMPSEKNLVVWGSGFMSSNSQFKVEPKKICAVRGPRTREVILKTGIYCPEIYGDPAMLYPCFYKPKIKKKYKLGVIPHYIDQNNPLLNIFNNESSVLIIDIRSGIKKVVDDICSCEIVASSSLHGLIAADSYSVPSIWIEFSKNVSGDGFKFYDYFESVGRENEAPLIIVKSTTIKEIIDSHKDYKLELDLDKLIDSCPFISNETKIQLITKMRDSQSPYLSSSV